MAVFVDVHIHLADPAYANKVESLLDIARRENVAALVGNSMDLDTSKASVDLSLRNLPLVYAAVGLHPWSAQTAQIEEVNRIEALVREKRDHVFAIGEVGLDRSYAKTEDKLEQQHRIFKRQLELAERMNLPVIVHSRNSAREVLDTLKSYAQKRVLMHWYTGPLEYVRYIADNGWSLSFGPSIFYSSKVREIVSKASLECLLTETDGPVTYRGPFQGRETTPEFIPPMVEEAAQLLGMDSTKLADRMLENFNRLFGVRTGSG